MIDILDEKIISELDNNARQSNSKIAKKLRVAKSVIAYRIKNLEKSGLIKRYYAVIDSYRLGYSSYRIYLKLKNADPEKEHEMIDCLTKLPQTRWVGLIKGTHNIGVVFLVKTQQEFVDVWTSFNLKYREYLAKIQPGISYGLERYRLPFAKKHLKSRAKVDIVQVGPTIDIDETDSELLHLLSANARMSLLEISEKIGLSSPAVQYRINQLIENKVLLGYRSMLNMELLGYTLYKIDFNLRTPTAAKQMQRFAREHENIFCLVKTLCGSDVEFEVYAKSTRQFYEILDEIRSKFQDNITEYDFFMYSEIIKFRYTPY